MSDESRAWQALCLAQQHRLSECDEVFSAARQEPQALWFCDDCRQFRTAAMHLPDFGKRQLYHEPATRCTDCGASGCKDCLVECKACKEFMPGDYVTRVCLACKPRVIDGLCLACIKYYGEKSLHLTEETYATRVAARQRLHLVSQESYVAPM